jgi:hypothetical protein
MQFPPTAPGDPLPPEGPAPVVARLAGQIDCSAVVATRELVCKREEAPAPAGISATQVPDDGQIKVRPRNVRYDTIASIFSFDVAIENLLTEPIGTPDGRTQSGIKAVYHNGPVATTYYAPGGTDSTRVANPDGTASLTRKNQPYHLYETVLAPGGTTQPLNGRLEVPRTVETFEFTILIFAARPGLPRVPDLPPDSVPEWIHAAENMTNYNSPHMSGRYPRNSLWVIFDPSATQEEKQAALDFVGVNVVGGDPVLRAYLVRIQDDGTTYPLFEVIEKLEGLPQVRFTLVDAIISGTHLRPTDEADGWSKDAWSLNPDLAGGLRWGLERIRAPLAWGCETGDSTLKVAVVDFGFHEVDDLEANAPGATVFGKWPGEKHGTEVASVLGARGDNGVQMAGIMWQAHLELYDSGQLNDNGKVGIGLRRMARAVVEAGKSADVINLSAGLWWERDAERPPYTEYIDIHNNPSIDSAVVEKSHMALFAALYELEELHNRRPLIVLSASNDGIDAYWSGLANVAADPEFRDRVIVVGASNILDERSSFSNHNITTNLVSVLAPGEGIGALDHTGQVIPASGASIAAPMVAGLAGLLKSFDPRLTAEKLKEHIIAGAERSGRDADGIPIIDAYESLKRAAQDPGAPLCGNQVWAENGVMKASRGQAVDNLFSVPPALIGLSTLHGGRRVRLLDLGQQALREWQLSSHNWVEVSPAPDVETRDLVGSYTSILGYSHDVDKQVRVISSSDPHQASVTIRLQDFLEGKMTDLVTHHFSAPVSTSDVCGRDRAVFKTDSTGTYLDHYACADTMRHVIASKRMSFQAAISPVGDKIFLAVSETNYGGGNLSPFEPCVDTDSSQGYPKHRCRRSSINGQTGGYRVYSMPLSDPSSLRLVWTSSDGEAARLGLAEDAREAVVHLVRHRYSQTSFYELIRHGEYRLVHGSHTSTTGCSTEFWSTVTGRISRSVPFYGGCDNVYAGSGSGGFSGSLLSSVGGGLLPDAPEASQGKSPANGRSASRSH